MSHAYRDLADFYSRPDGDSRTLFQIWERGEARGDSVTPSTYSAPYRRWIVETLLDALRDGDGDGDGHGLLSLGCGNAVVEREIAGKGYDVLAVDLLPEAVAIASGKGLRAIQADVTTWSPEEHWPVVYMDGLLGHLYDPVSRSLPVLRHMRSWMRASTLVASSDGTPDGQDAQRVPAVPGYYWLSENFLHRQAVAAGFDRVSSTTFIYERPVSGPRRRSILIAHAVGER